MRVGKETFFPFIDFFGFFRISVQNNFRANDFFEVQLTKTNIKILFINTENPLSSFLKKFFFIEEEE